MAVITFPNVAALVIARLRIALPALVIHHDVPNPRPEAFVRVFRTGGPKATLVTDAAQLTFESWALDADTAERNAQSVRSYVNDLPGRVLSGSTFYRVDELSGPAELPDPVSTSRRVTWSASVHVRGV